MISIFVQPLVDEFVDFTIFMEKLVDPVHSHLNSRTSFFEVEENDVGPTILVMWILTKRNDRGKRGPNKKKNMAWSMN